MESFIIVGKFIISVIATVFTAIVAPFLLWKHKENVRERKEMEHRLLTIESRYMTEEKTKAMLREEMAPLRTDISDIKKSLDSLRVVLDDLVIEARVARRLKEEMEKKGEK